MQNASNLLFFFFNDTATTEIYTLSLHDALPIWWRCRWRPRSRRVRPPPGPTRAAPPGRGRSAPPRCGRDREEHTSELQSRQYLVCRLLLEKKKKHHTYHSFFLHLLSTFSPPSTF